MTQRDTMFAPFQRLGDTPQGEGVGLGLAVARGLADAVDATIEVDDTPGGGLTMIITVPIAGNSTAENSTALPPRTPAASAIGDNG